MKSLIASSALAAVLATGTAYAQSGPKVEVLHWLTAGAESAAINELAKGVAERGGVWVDLGTPGGGAAARTLLSTGLAGGNPPGVAFEGLGTVTGELAAQGVMRDISGYATEKGYLENVPEYALSMGRGEDKGPEIYALPVAFETQNFMWYSKPVFDAAGIEPPKTWDAFIEQAPNIQAAGFTPIAVGGQSWQINLLLNSIILGEGGDYYESLFSARDAAAMEAPQLVHAFSVLRALSGLTDEGSPNRSWNDTLNLVADGRAAIQIMGSWAGAELASMGKEYGADWGCAISPGAQIVMVGVTGFQFPDTKSEEGAAGQNIFIDAMMDPAVQTAFSVQKGSIPARTDADTSDLSECSRISAAIVREGNGQPNTNGWLKADLRGQLTDYAANFWANASITPEEGAAEFARILASN